MLYKKFNALFLCLILLITITGCRNINAESKNIVNTDNEQVLDFKEDMDMLVEYRNRVIKERFRNQKIVITATGDIMLGRGVGSRLRKSGLDLAYKNFYSEFNKADILFGNLENPISDRGKKMPGKGICLRANPKMSKVLSNSGFDVVSLANNHILDYDSEALIDTFNILKENNIAYIGAGKDINEARTPYITKIKNKRIAFLAYDEFAYYYYSSSYKRRFVATKELPGTAPKEEETIIEDIEKIRDKVDILVVSFHWGIEETNHITEEQRNLAHKLIDNGVDIILGHHPHVIQPIEIYKGKPIVYSMGNYIFDQNDENNKQGMVVNIIIENGAMIRVEAIPLYIKDKREPLLAKGEKGEIIKDKIINLSQGLKTKGRKEEDRVTFEIQ